MTDGCMVRLADSLVGSWVIETGRAFLALIPRDPIPGLSMIATAPGGTKPPAGYAPLPNIGGGIIFAGTSYMLFGRAPVDAEGLRTPGVGKGCGAGRRTGREGCVSELAFLTGDFSGLGLSEMVTLRLIFLPLCSRSLAATHSGQAGSLHWTILIFFFGVGAVVDCVCWVPLSVARRRLEVVEV